MRMEPVNFDILPLEELGGWTDPIGQIQSWFFSQISGLISSLSSGLQNFINSALSGISKVINQIAGFASAIGSSFISFVKDPMGTIQSALKYLWDITPDFIKTPLTIVGNVFSQVGQAIINFFRDPIGSLQGLANYFWSITPPWLQNVVQGLTNFVGALGTSFINFVKDPVGTITGGLRWIVDQVSGVIKPLQDAASKISELVKMPVESLSAGISNVLSGKVFDWFSSAFSQAIGGIGDAIIHSIVDPVAKFFDEHIVQPVKNLPTWLMQKLGDAAGVLATLANEKILPAATGVLNFITLKVKDLFKSFLTKIQEFVERIAATKPENWVDVAAELASMGLIVAVPMTALSTKLLGFGLDLAPLANTVTSVINANTLLNPVMSAMLGAGFGITLQRYINKKYQNWLPDARTAYDMMRENIITFDAAADLAAYQGISKEWWGKLVDLWDWDPGVGDLVSWANYVEIEDDIISKVLDISRVPSEWRTFFVDMIHLRPLRNEISAWLSSVITLRGEGYVTKETYEQILEQARAEKWIKSKELELRKKQGDLVFTRNLLDVKVSTERYKFRKKLIDAATLEANLIALGLDPLMANAIRENEEVRITEVAQAA